MSKQDATANPSAASTAYEQLAFEKLPPAFLLDGEIIVRTWGDVNRLFDAENPVAFIDVGNLPDGVVKSKLLEIASLDVGSISRVATTLGNVSIKSIPGTEIGRNDLVLVVFELSPNQSPDEEAIAPAQSGLHSREDPGFPISNLQSMFWETDPAGDVSFVDDNELAFTGRTLAQFVRQGWAEALHPEDKEKSLDLIANALNSRTPFGFQSRRRRFDGQYFWFNSYGLPWFDKAGTFLGYKGFCFEITEQLAIQSELFSNQRLMRLVLDNSPYLTAFVDRQLQYQYVNSKYAEFWDAPANEIIGMRVQELTGEFFESLDPFFQTALAGETVFHEMVVPNEDGEESRLLEITHVPARGIDSNVFGFYCFINEVTESRKHERLLRLVQDHVPAMMVLLSSEFELKYANEQFLSHLSIENEDVFGKGLEQVIGKSAFSAARPYLQKALNGEKCSFEIQLPTMDGILMETLMNIVPEIDESHNVNGICGLLVDISESKYMQNELRRSEARFELAVSGSQVGIIEFDLERPDWFFADHVERLLGMNKGELKNSRKKIRELIHPDDLAQNEVSKFMLETGLESKLEIRLKTKAGDYRWFELFSRDKSEDCSQDSRPAGTITDINDLKTAQLDAKAQLKQRDEFLAMLSHELRNPMAAISLSLDFLDMSAPLAGKHQESLLIIKKQTMQISRLLDDLLDVSRVTSNRIVFDNDVHDIRDLIDDTVASFSLKFKHKNQQFHVELSEQPLLVQGDAFRLKQVITNLLENANKYTPEKGQVWLSATIADGEVLLTVRDSGIGLAEESIGKIFELFFQGQSTIHRSTGGMGVGLYMVNHIVAAHHGVITASSDGCGCGSQFEVRLPLAEGSFFASEAPVSKPEFESLHVVLVEDNEDCRMITSQLLTMKGFRVTQFADGETASAMIPDLQPDVAIIDVGLPGKNGLALAEEFASDPKLRRMKMIALTGYGQDSDRDSVYASGFDLFLVKPAGIDELCHAISDEATV